MVNINYFTEIVSEASVVKPLDCTSISFENLGTSDCTIMANIPLNPGDDERKFKNHPGEIIKSSFPVSFSGVGTKKILVTRTFAEIEKNCK